MHDENPVFFGENFGKKVVLRHAQKESARKTTFFSKVLSQKNGIFIVHFCVINYKKLFCFL